MASILVFGYQQDERDAFALVLEFAGHHCATAGTFQEAVDHLRKESFDVLLADSILGQSNSEQFVRMVKEIAPGLAVMVLTEDADTPDEVITHYPSSPTRNLSAQFSVIGKGDAFMVLLPEEESLQYLNELPERAGFLNKLAVLYHSQEKYSTAEQLYKRALKIKGERTIEQDRAAASILNNLARLYHDQKDYAQAESLYRRSLEIVERIFGPNDSTIARRLSNLADLYRVQGKNSEAVSLDQRRRQIEMGSRR